MTEFLCRSTGIGEKREAQGFPEVKEGKVALDRSQEGWKGQLSTPAQSLQKARQGFA